MKCNFTVMQIGPNSWRHTCERCGKQYIVPADTLHADCLQQPSVQGTQPTTVAKGPGDYLHDSLLRWFGEKPTAKCKCKNRIAQMNAWGPAVCRERLEIIVAWLIEEADRRGWKIATKIPVLPKVFLRRLVLAAIKESEHFSKLEEKETDAKL